MKLRLLLLLLLLLLLILLLLLFFLLLLLLLQLGNQTLPNLCHTKPDIWQKLTEAHERLRLAVVVHMAGRTTIDCQCSHERFCNAGD